MIAELADPEEETGSEPMKSGSISAKILIVDDNPENLQVMERILEDGPHEIVTALSGREALKLILQNDFALILMDVRMPIMDGFETARIIREREKSSHIPIMFLTAYARDDARQLAEGYSLGAVDFLIKPIAPEVLRAKAAAFAELYRKNQILHNQKRILRASHDSLITAGEQGTVELAATTDELFLANAELNVMAGALQAQKIVMSNTIANVPGMVWEAWGSPGDPAQSVDFISDFAEQLLGYSVEECLSIPNFWREVMHPDDRKQAVGATLCAYQDRKSGISQFRCIKKDGTAIWVECHFAVVLDDHGEPVGMRGVTLDITDRKVIEKQIEDSLREKDLLLREIHHRVKNNLQIVSSILTLQSNYIRDPQLLDIFRESQARIKAISLIHELLYEKKGRLARIDFKDYLAILVENVFITIGADSRIEHTIESDSALLELDAAIHCGLIVNELLTNAIKYAFPDGRKGCISIRLQVENGGCVLTIQDNGIGLPADLKVKTSTSMGLQLVDTLVKQMRATIEVHREGGACFVMRFPYSNPDR